MNTVNEKNELLEVSGLGFASPQIDKISAALAAAQGEIGRVVKNEETKGEGKFAYTYATLDAVMAVVKPVQSKHNLAIIQRPDGANLHTILTHGSGQWIDYGNYPLGQSGKHQERGSALTYARRYTTCAIFGIAPEEDDDGAKGNDSLGKGEPPVQRHTPNTVRGNPAKEKYEVKGAILQDGTLDFDHIAGEIEILLGDADSPEHVSLINRANAKSLKAMQTERPDLFGSLGELFRNRSSQLM